MHLFGIKESYVVFQMPCPGCHELVGLSMQQLEDGIKRDGFEFTCPKGGEFTISDLLLLREYFLLHFDFMQKPA